MSFPRRESTIDEGEQRGRRDIVLDNNLTIINVIRSVLAVCMPIWYLGKPEGPLFLSCRR